MMADWVSPDRAFVVGLLLGAGLTALAGLAAWIREARHE